jgi:glycosyltransferase involved in cell wall biosynthesis
MPSTAEACGLMAIEAMACGTPVIAFDGTSLPGILCAPEGGLAVPQGDVPALTATLERLLRDGEERERLGRRARAIAQRQYDVRDHYDRIIDLYRNILSRQGTAGRKPSVGETEGKK